MGFPGYVIVDVRDMKFRSGSRFPADITYFMNRNISLAGLAVAILYIAGSASINLEAQPIILNEFNAVGSTRFLKNSNSDERLGIIEGNGGNWIEFVVVEDHADLRGLELRWAEETTVPPTETVWDPTRPLVQQGLIRFLDNPALSDLRIGTILTITETEVLVDGDGNQVVNGTDLSFNPSGDDWWINVWTFDSDLVETLTNVPGDLPGNFSVGNDNWEISLFDPAAGDAGEIIWGPLGEGVDGFGGGIGADEIGKLELDPQTGVTIFDYNDGSSSSFGGPNVWSAGTITQDFSVLRAWAASTGGGNSVPVTIQVDDQGVISIAWERLPGLEYELQRAPSIASPAWERVSFYPMILDDSINHSEDLDVPAGDGSSFFRVLSSNP